MSKSITLLHDQAGHCGPADTLYLITGKTKIKGQRAFHQIMPVKYQPDTRTLVHLKTISSHWPQDVLARMSRVTVVVSAEER